MFNYHNEHVWADENPSEIISGHHEQCLSINVRAGITGDGLAGPYMLPARLTGRRYPNSLQITLPTVLEDWPLITRQSLFMHDDHPAHNGRIACDCPDETFSGRWIGGHGPFSWPPRSPDLSRIDYFLWGSVKSIVYATLVQSPEGVK
jgi:hypothetical protein